MKVNTKEIKFTLKKRQKKCLTKIPQKIHLPVFFIERVDVVVFDGVVVDVVRGFVIGVIDVVIVVVVGVVVVVDEVDGFLVVVFDVVVNEDSVVIVVEVGLEVDGTVAGFSVVLISVDFTNDAVFSS